MRALLVSLLIDRSKAAVGLPVEMTFLPMLCDPPRSLWASWPETFCFGSCLVSAEMEPRIFSSAPPVCVSCSLPCSNGALAC